MCRWQASLAQIVLNVCMPGTRAAWSLATFQAIVIIICYTMWYPPNWTLKRNSSGCVQADFVTETKYVSAVYHMCSYYMYSLDCDWYRFDEMLNVDACADQCVQCTLTILSMSTILSSSPEVPTLLWRYIAQIVLNVCMPGTRAAWSLATF